MSFKVAIVCEDPTYDRYIAEPIVLRVCELIGRPRAQVRTVDFPKACGVSQVKAEVCEFLLKWGPISDAVVFMIDADGEDGEDGRPDRALQFRNAAAGCDTTHCHVITVALQELEVWALWGCYQQLGVPWAEVRAEPDPKERFYDGQITASDAKTADGGRRRMIQGSLGKGWHTLEAACTELGGLREDLAACL